MADPWQGSQGSPPSPYSPQPQPPASTYASQPSPAHPAHPDVPFESRRMRRRREAGQPSEPAQQAGPGQAARGADQPHDLPPPAGSVPASRYQADGDARYQADGDARHQADGDAPDEPARIPPLILPMMGTLLLAWALATLIADVDWGPLSILPVGLASLSPLLPVPGLIVITLAIRRRNWVAVVPAAAAAVLPWTFMIGYLVPAPPVTGPTMVLRALLVTAHDGNANAADINAAVRTQHADVVVITELTPGLAHDLTATGLARALAPRYVAVPDDAPPTAGLAVYSRYPVEDAQPLAGTQWPAVQARVMVGTTPVTLVAGHAVKPTASHLDAWRTDLRAFGTAARMKGPVLVLANLNATPWHAQFRHLVSGRLHDAADVLGRGLRPTWPAWSVATIVPTDHVLVAGLGVTSLKTVTISDTDHLALSMVIQVPTVE